MARRLQMVRSHSLPNPQESRSQTQAPAHPEQWDAPFPTSPPRRVCRVWAGGCGFISQHEAHPFAALCSGPHLWSCVDSHLGRA